jgi:hypothetical protein
MSTRTFDAWRDRLCKAVEKHDSYNWVIGDLLVEGEKLFEIRAYTEAQELTGFERNHLRDIAWVAANVSASVRTDNLSWSHHRQIAHLKPAKQKELLDKAVKEGLGVAQLRDLAKEPRNKGPKKRKTYGFSLPLTKTELDCLKWHAKKNGQNADDLVYGIVRDWVAKAQGLVEGAAQ